MTSGSTAAPVALLAVIVTVHALATLKHHYVDRDRTLARMLPLAKPAPEPEDTPGA